MGKLFAQGNWRIFLVFFALGGELYSPVSPGVASMCNVSMQHEALESDVYIDAPAHWNFANDGRTYRFSVFSGTIKRLRRGGHVFQILAALTNNDTVAQETGAYECLPNMNMYCRWSPTRHRTQARAFHEKRAMVSVYQCRMPKYRVAGVDKIT